MTDTPTSLLAESMTLLDFTARHLRHDIDADHECVACTTAHQVTALQDRASKLRKRTLKP